METLALVISLVSGILGILSTVYSVKTFINTRSLANKMQEEERRLNMDVKIRFKGPTPKKSIFLNLVVKRRDVTRNEINGILGMLPRRGGEQKRYKIAYLSTNDYLKQIYKVQNSRDEIVLEIPITLKELDQFDFEKSQEI